MSLNTVVGIRLKAEDRALLFKVCEARGEDPSGFIRRAIRKQLAELGYFDDDTKKALGIPIPKGEQP